MRLPSGYVKIAIEHGPFKVGLLIKDGDGDGTFSDMAVLTNDMVKSAPQNGQKSLPKTLCRWLFGESRSSNSAIHICFLHLTSISHLIPLIRVLSG